ncbi:MAG: translocation/assembly module TamB [Nitrospirae bacterium]|nr:translocation/assembly module TamB [Nitrospirota bacterium]
MKKILIVFTLALIIGLTAAFFRGRHLSDFLKGLILPELSDLTGERVTAERISVNIFPLFAEATEVRMYDTEGRMILRIPKVKGYVELSGLLRKEVILRRLVMKSADVQSDADRIEAIIGHVKDYLAVERKNALKVVIRTAVLEGSSFALGLKDGTLKGSGFDVEAVIKPAWNLISRKHPGPRITFTLKELSSSVKGWPELTGDIKGTVALRDDAIDVKALRIGFLGSRVNARGVLRTAGKEGEPSGDFQIGLDLLADTVRKIFGLTRPGEGRITAKGTVHLVPDDLLRSEVDMDLKGSFYVETLMEVLKVKERVEGLVDFTGKMKGPLNRLTGTARAHLKKGNLFNVLVDDVTCTVLYGDEMLHFSDGKALLYHGRATADAALSVGAKSYYSLKVTFADIDSKGAFALIGWDPGVPAGKVKGGLSTEGASFNPSGWYSYESTARGNDILGRVRRIKGSFSLRDDVVTLSESVASTDKSSIGFSGSVDLKASGLSLTVQVRTEDVRDLTLPYLRELAGSAEFSGRVSGRFEDPQISGKVGLHAASYEGYFLGEVAGEVAYRKNLLNVGEVSAVSGTRQEATVAVKGNIRFPEAKELFDVRKPLYNLNVSMKNGDIERALKVIYKKQPKIRPTGRFDAGLSITGAGPTPLFKGSVRGTHFTAEGVPVDSASFLFAYDYIRLALDDVVLKKGDSVLTGSGSISGDDRFTFRSAMSKIYAKDLPLPVRGIPSDASVTFRAEGKGTIKDPRIELEGTVRGGKVRNADLGGGTIKASVKERTADLTLTLFDGRAVLHGAANLNEEIPWRARLEVKSGRYDSVLAAFLKDVPEDLLINMKGSADMSGDRNHFSADAFIEQLNATLYGNNVSNDGDIRFAVKGRKVFLSEVKLRSGSASFKASGETEIGREYNLVMEGSSSLLPLKGFVRKIDTIRGDAGFVFSVTGKWDDPKINGGVTLSNAVFALKDMPYRLSSLNGYLYIDEDRVVIQKLSGKMAGGDVDVSGIAFLRRFALKRFYVNAAMSAISVNVSKEFTANFSGSMLYSGTPESQVLSGEIRINRALYKEPIEWQLSLLRARKRERPRGDLGAFEKTQLNLRLQGADTIMINNNLARASLSADLVVRGTVASPLLFGRVETKGGIVYFRNNEFKILGATADFADPKRINPTMNIIAETTIQGYTVRLNLDGQMEHFNLSLSSTPSLEQIEILSLLTVGTLSNEPKGIQGGIGVSAATSFLSGQVQNIAQERLRSLTGIDRIGVESSVSRVTGKSEQRLTVSKRLLGDRVSVTYSTALGSVATDVIRIEYNIGNNVSLLGERDDVGALGGSIKFRFGFK